MYPPDGRTKYYEIISIRNIIYNEVLLQCMSYSINTTELAMSGRLSLKLFLGLAGTDVLEPIAKSYNLWHIIFSHVKSKKVMNTESEHI